MKKFIIGLLCVGFFSTFITETVFAGGVSICIAKDNDSNDIEYFLRYSANDEVNGYDAWKSAREDYALKYKGTPTCINSAMSKTGHWVVLKSNNRPLNKWALGFGDTPAEALASAKSEIGNRDWGWNDQRDGSSVEEQGRF